MLEVLGVKKTPPPKDARYLVVVQDKDKGMMRLMLKVLLFLQAVLLIEARTQSRRRKDEDEFDTMSDYLMAFAKVTLACSPILAIGGMLFFAREDEEDEAAKVEAAKKSASCKT